MEIKFQCLGDLEITCGDRVMPAGGPLQRGLLAMLLLNANLSISADRLIDALWDDPPDTALGQLQTRIWRLRQLLRAPAPGTSWSTPELITRPGGYALMVDPAAVDLLVFQQRIRDAESMLAGDRPREAALELRSALALFRGPAFANVTAVGVAGEVVAIEERRRAALEQIFDIELSLGMHAQLIAELREAVAANPYQERLRLHLMRALYRSGRRAEAVAAYREGHRTMVDGAGLEPSRELKELHRRILLSDVPSAPSVASVAPVTPAALAETPPPPPAAPVGSWAPQSRDLPRDVTNLVGRCPEITHLTDYLSGPGHHLPRVVALSGMPGVGKTALAVRLAHTLAGAAPDGQLFAWLGGKSEPTEILHRFLRTLGVAESEVPATLAERSALFRACTAGRRLVLVLDDAHGEAQVRPLLPAGPATLTLVTSLRPLTALDGAQLRDLAPLEPSEAIRLLTDLVGEERVRAEPAVPQRIATWCEGLPLA
ncbi:BTAD domain-containing putative transcriptional regulator, partial [Micromonospora sp. NPDC000207]|uniref:AfsR/SARP family transcriptional regulator n=1 Tax=Micromonospora sp. NPDC000207 TaxID=3154246 RepID=UPI0033191867